MNNINIKDYNNINILTEEELDIIYTYLDINLEILDSEEVDMWHNLLIKLDPEYKNYDSNSDFT